MPRVSPKRVVDAVSQPVKQTMSMVSFILPYAVLVAVVFWVVYVAKYSEFGSQADAKGHTNQEKYNIAFQAVVATFIVYFLFR